MRKSIHINQSGTARLALSFQNSVAPSGLADVRRLHPELSQSGRLIEIKKEWAPALSVVVRTAGRPRVATQTCDDFEVVLPLAGSVLRDMSK